MERRRGDKEGGSRLLTGRRFSAVKQLGWKMFVGICRLELHLLDSTSLKEKRQVLRSIMERLKNRFNLSIAEVGCQDALRRAEIGLALVSNETIYLEKVIGKVVSFIEADGRVQIIKIDKEIY